jgi:hypothetical protein
MADRHSFANARRESKQNRHESATRESNPILSGKASQKVAPTRIRREGLRKLSALTAPSSRNRTRRLKREQRARESHCADPIRTRGILQSASAPVRPIFRDRLREGPTPGSAPHPATGRGGGSGNKERANRGRRDSIERRRVSQGTMAVGSPNCPVVVKGTISLGAGGGPAMRTGSGKWEQRTRESWSASRVEPPSSRDS